MRVCKPPAPAHLAHDEEPKFREQVEWELAGLERADLIAMWFAPDTKSPITLLDRGRVRAPRHPATRRVGCVRRRRLSCSLGVRSAGVGQLQRIEETGSDIHRRAR